MCANFNRDSNPYFTLLYFNKLYYWSLIHILSKFHGKTAILYC